MNYPLISEYIEAIKSAEDNFNELSYLRPVLDDDGLPVMTSGNFAVVFKMIDKRNRKPYAVKCFTKEQKGRTEAYYEITRELEECSSPYFISVRYIEKELFVDTAQTAETEFPVLLMKWVEGKPLDKYVRENINNIFLLKMLVFRFGQLSKWLVQQPFAHGDVKPDNIIVLQNGALVLVDYDGMYVPAMKGQSSRELGSYDFCHPKRTENVFNESIDDFPLISILLSLKLISIDPVLLDRFGTTDRLLFSKEDYLDISKCKLLKHIYPSLDSEVNKIVNGLVVLLTNTNIRLSSSDYDANNEMEELSTIVQDEEYDDSFVDKDVVYSNNLKKILGCADVTNYNYCIKEGCEIICDNAFRGMCQMLESIIIPSGVKAIGRFAFSGCYLQSVVIPHTVRVVGDEAFSRNPFLCSICIPSSVEYIGKSIFKGCNDYFVIYVEEGATEKFKMMLPEYKDKIEEGMIW